MVWQYYQSVEACKLEWMYAVYVMEFEAIQKAVEEAVGIQDY